MIFFLRTFCNPLLFYTLRRGNFLLESYLEVARSERAARVDHFGIDVFSLINAYW
uniref:Uncharacterized protein n=1 Tax=Arundo donax TaxID=35708 RepID=A0A0A9HWU0_ARUDO